MKITKTLKGQYVKNQLKTNPVWAKKALKEIYKNQTDDEQRAGCTTHDNGIGFSGADSEFLSSLAVQLNSRGTLSPKQMIFLHKRISKYWNQVLTISNQDQLELCVTRAILDGSL